jgi:N4-gp56 family major capsid protein
MDRNTFKHLNFANEVSSTTARGSALSIYMNAPAEWQGELSDGAKSAMYWLDSVDVKMKSENVAYYVVNKRNYYPLGTGVSFDSSEATTSDISNYGTNHIDGVSIQPGPYAKSAVVTNYAENQNLRDLIRDKMDELSYALADKVDNYIAAAIGDATETTSTVAGAMTLYGGSAAADSGLGAGDVLTTEIINKAEILLAGKYAYYWTGGVFTKSSGVKNPWSNAPTDPFVLIIGQHQKKALRDSSQFTNAAEYGSRVVISSGEIGDYLGIRVICSNNVESVAAAGTAPDGGSAPSVDMTRCILMKGRAAYTFVWGRAPKFSSWELPWRDQRGITLTCDYAGSVIHSDAVIKIDVADN